MPLQALADELFNHWVCWWNIPKLILDMDLEVKPHWLVDF